MPELRDGRCPQPGSVNVLITAGPGWAHSEYVHRVTRVLTDAEAADLDDIAAELSQLRATLAEATERRRDAITRVPISQRASAINLIQYLALRSRDERPLQRRLVGWGLSTLGRSEAHVAATLGAVQRSIALMRDQQVSIEPASVDMSQAAAVAKSRVDELLGGAPAHRVTRIMVTLPSEAATRPELVYSLVAAGMDCARINTAHDDEATWKQMVTHVRSAAEVLDASCRVLIDLPGPKLRTGAIAPGPTGKEWIALARGDRLILTSGAGDAPKQRRSSQAAHSPPRVACTLPAVLAQVQAGQPIWFDDGKIGGVIEDASPDELTVVITHARAKGERLRSDKGINLPQTAIDLPALGADDLASLPFVARTADLVGLSFAQSPSDVRELRARLNDLAAQQVGIVLKIETVRGFDALPELILAGLEGGLVGVMIAQRRPRR